MRFGFVGLLAFSLTVQAQTPCEVPRIRETAPLAAGITQDKAMAQVFLSTSQACQMAQSDACDAARLTCGNQLASTLKAQVGLDDGAWLRDMLLPYAGLAYPATRQFQAGAMAMDTACNGDANQLMSASSRRSLQAARRQAILEEYPRYVLWVNDQAKACKERSSADEARRNQERQEAERLAAVAAAAKMTEEQRQKAEAESKRRAEEVRVEAERKQKEAYLQAEKERQANNEKAQEQKAEAEKRARAEKAEADKRAKEEREEAEDAALRDRKKAEKAAEEAKERAETEKREAKAQAEREAQKAKEEKEAAERKARDEAERQKAEAERKARDAEELRIVTAREEKKNALRTQKEKLLADASQAERRASEIAGMSFTAEQSQQAAQLNTERLQAIERAKTLREQASKIVIDDEDERSRGSVGLLAGAGAASWPNTASGALGGQAVLHFGFWGTAPSEGLASGFEVRVLGRYLSTLGTVVQQAEGVATARYFFGRIGVGGSMEVRWNQPSMQTATTNIGFGPSIGIAFVDSPKTRVMLNASWLPLTQQGFQNPYRTTGDLEISYDFLVFDVAGGLQTQPVDPTAGTILAWYFGAFAGARLHW